MIDALAGAEFAALGTTASVVVSDGSINAAAKLLADELDAFDRACSRFRPDSELTAVNSGDGRAVAVGPLLIEAVETALRAARLTDGRVDPTVGSALRVLGYDRDFALVDRHGPPRRIRVARVPGWKVVDVDRERGAVRVPDGVQLDLGATAKALAADHAADRISHELGGGVLISLGGDVAISGSPPAHGWPVRVVDDHARPDDPPGETVTLRSGGLATSSVVVRRWRRGAEHCHHLVDPATGLPADGPFRTVSVAAATCVDANIATTAAMMLGHAAPAWLEEQGLPARLVTDDGHVSRVGGWSPPGDDT